MERLRFRSTSLIHLMAELHQRDLLDEARSHERQRAVPRRRRSLPFGLSILSRRPG